MAPGILEQSAQLLVMALTAFAASTLLPVSSEIALVAALKTSAVPAPAILAAATFGNVAGSCFNWWIGWHARRFVGRRWFPFTSETIGRAEVRFRRYGTLSLLFAWLPFVGDPLTFVAGALSVPFATFVTLVTIGKAARYVALAIGSGSL